MNANRASRTPGLTLIELLAALVVLSLFVALAGGWLVSSAKAAAALETGADRGAAARRAMTLLLDDLDAADVSNIELVDGSLTFTTLNPSPVDRSAWAQVAWTISEAGALVRSSAPIGAQDAEPNLLRIADHARLEARTLSDTPPSPLWLHLDLPTGSASAVWEPLP